MTASHSERLSEERVTGRRWTIYRKGVSERLKPFTGAGSQEVVEVMPVSEHKAVAAELERFRGHVDLIETERNVFENACRAICGPSDGGPLMDAYRAAGGGYEGLQAIAQAAVDYVEERRS